MRAASDTWPDPCAYTAATFGRSLEQKMTWLSVAKLGCLLSDCCREGSNKNCMTCATGEPNCDQLGCPLSLSTCQQPGCCSSRTICKSSSLPKQQLVVMICTNRQFGSATAAGLTNKGDCQQNNAVYIHKLTWFARLMQTLA